MGAPWRFWACRVKIFQANSASIFTCIASVRAARHHTQWGLLLVSGLLSIVVGLLALASLVWLLGGYALLIGVLFIFMGTQFRKIR